MAYSIELKFYNDNNEVINTFRRSFVPFGILKSAARFYKLAGTENDLSQFDEETVNDIADFVVEFFGKKFTREELFASTELGEVVTVMKQIITKVQGSGALDPTLPA